jgi:hypothetical protein
MSPERGLLPRDEVGNLVPPDTLPTDTRELLNMMDEAFRVAIMGEPGSRAWERAKLLFDLLHSHFQLRSAADLGEAHDGLALATRTLKVATWWLAGVTVFLGIVELLGFVHN